MIIHYTRIDSPIGALRLAASEDGLVAVEFDAAGHPVRRWPEWREGEHPLLNQAVVQLGEYFSGRRREFDLPVDPQGTDFQRTVWRALAAIPYGETLSYAELAARLGRPGSSRAVGAANGRNPLPIILPCHRVVGADGSLTGYSGGLAIKRHLLRLESALPAGDLFARAEDAATS